MKKGVVIGFSILIVVVLFIFFYLLFSKDYSCNDGTRYNECSNIKPYFCSNGVLIEKASICGCDKNLGIVSDTCVSSYQNGPKNITLHYVLRGEKREINFTVYKGMTDYLSKIPRYIESVQNPTLLDFKLRLIDEEQQRGLLLPLVVQIESLTKDKTDQARIAISIIQNIPFGNSTNSLKFGNIYVEYQRYPYEVLYDNKGICSEKSALLIFLLREMGYGTSSIYYNLENHEAVGIECPKEKGVNNSSYCFVETTGPSIITDDETEYFGVDRQLSSIPKVINISTGISLEKNLYEYKDAEILINVRKDMKVNGEINPLQYFEFQNLRGKYGLIVFNKTYNSYTF